MSDESKKRSQAWGRSALVLLLLAYPLSIGPAGYLSDHATSLEAALFLGEINEIYAPIYWASERSESTATVLHCYCRLWMRPLPTGRHP